MTELATTYPLLAPWHRRAVCSDRLLFGHGDHVVTLRGRATATLLPRLLPLLDGTRSVDEVVAELGDAARPAVLQALTLLEGQGLLVSGPPLDSDDPLAATAQLLASQTHRAAPSRVAETLRAARVGVVGRGTTAAAVQTTLVASGVEAERRTFDEGLDRDELAVVAPAPAELPLVAEWNRRALEKEQTWMLVLAFDGATAFVGPIFLPPETACYECLRHRRAANLPFGDDYWRLEREPAAHPTAPFADAIASGFAALGLLRWLAVRDPLLAGATYALDLGRDPTFTRHVVYPVPRCEACSGAADLAPVSPWFE